MNTNPQFTDDEIYRMRQFLARRWHQNINQVTDTEARAYLIAERGVESERRSGDTGSSE